MTNVMWIMFNIANQSKHHDTALHTLPHSNFVMIRKGKHNFFSKLLELVKCM